MIRAPDVETNAGRYESMLIHVEERSIWQHVTYARETDAPEVGDTVRTAFGGVPVYNAPVVAAGPIVRAGWAVDVESPASRWLRGAEDRPLDARAWRGASLRKVVGALFSGDVATEIGATLARFSVPAEASSRWALQALRDALPEPTTVRLQADGTAALAAVEEPEIEDLVGTLRGGYVHDTVECSLQAVWPGEIRTIAGVDIVVRSVRHEVRAGVYRTWVTADG